jgi:CysZ protein
MPLPQNFIAQAFVGLSYPVSAFGFLTKHRLWGKAAWAIVVNVLLLVVLVGAAALFAVPLLEQMDAAFANWAGDSSVLRGVVTFIGWLLWLGAVILLVASAGLVLMLVGQAVASPFLDALSERIEAIATGQPQPSFSLKRAMSATVMAVWDLVWGVFYWIVVNVPLALIGLTGVGAVPASIASFIFSALLLAHEFVGLALSRRFVGYRARFGVVWRNRWVCLGFGSACMALLLVPGLNLVLLPVAATGGTLLYCDLLRDQRLGAKLHERLQGERLAG